MNIWLSTHSVSCTNVQGTLLIKHVVNDREVCAPQIAPEQRESC